MASRARQQQWLEKNPIMAFFMHPVEAVEIVFCGPCAAAAQYNLIEYNRPGVNPLACCFPFVVDSYVLSLVAAPGINPGLSLLALINRIKIRQMYNLEGDILQDCLCATFLPQCILAQQHFELAKRGKPAQFIFSPPPPTHAMN